MSASLESFVNVLKQSGLVEETVLSNKLTEFQAAATVPSPERFASQLVEAHLITPWQATKLLQGKHRGFFLGKYKLLKLLGKGGMSSVYLAEHKVMRRRCAIKVLPAKLVHDAGFLDRFHREARAGAALDHPNIVRALDVDHVVDGNHEIHFLVMEFVDGRNLYDLVIASGPLDAVTAARFMRQGALGLGHAHRAGIIHRDVKPGNFIVDRQGNVKLTDLGLARIEKPDHEHSLTIQHDQKVFGTADYLAPEQAVDSHRVDPRADLYSLGCTFYFLLTGRPPFPDGTLTQRLLAHQSAPPPDVSRSREDVPQTLARILQYLLGKRPEDRPQSAEEVAKLLGDWLREQGEQVDRDGEAAQWRAPPASQSPPTVPTQRELARAVTPLPGSTDTVQPGDPVLSHFLSRLDTQEPPSFVKRREVAPSSAVFEEDVLDPHDPPDPAVDTAIRKEPSSLLPWLAAVLAVASLTGVAIFAYYTLTSAPP